MEVAILQLWEPAMPPGWAVVFQQATQVLSVVIGVLIAYQAYRGYRRNDSRPMFYIALGFTLALAVPFCIFLLYGILPGLPVTAVIVTSQLSQVSGLVAILYALWMPT
ncbi:DUF7521 family protein [Halobaculum roseum]|uniref:Uncharacterized protein n=1 Tax=Halobaculum roseum TaxID=2175149 RepID=A0ABD5MP52_9EURY|nr:hypothetical protein [Halobaculum roseum]QZY01992.1 hypothetical protein K6T36_11825 [Halobaculum roseum]